MTTNEIKKNLAERLSKSKLLVASLSSQLGVSSDALIELIENTKNWSYSSKTDTFSVKVNDKTLRVKTDSDLYQANFTIV